MGLHPQPQLYFFRFSIRPDWITGGLGSTASQLVCFFSSCRIITHPGSSIPPEPDFFSGFFPLSCEIMDFL